jgi:putative transposase
MENFQNKYRMATTRIRNWSYSSEAWCYVTICTDQRKYFFGNMNKDDVSVRLTILGRIASQFFQDIPNHFPFVKVEAFVIMPNQVQGLLKFNKQDERPNEPNSFDPHSKNLASVIHGFKGAVQTFATLNRIPFQWQRSYHCTVTQSQKRVDIICQYINSNPAKWIEKMKAYEKLKMRGDQCASRDAQSCVTGIMTQIDGRD